MDPVFLFYHVDEFCKLFEKEMVNYLLPKSALAHRKSSMTVSEIITLRVMYHTSGYKTVKDFFIRENKELISYFPNLVSYSRFVELCTEHVLPFLIFAKVCCSQSDGINYIDSTKLAVCHVKRASSHKTFKGIATKGCTSVGWFYGFKLHLITNAFGRIVDFEITSGNIADNNENLLLKITKKIKEKLFGDRGYLINPKLFAQLFSRGITIITKIRANMKPRIMSFSDRIALQKRGISETIIGVLKENLSLEHSRHRSPYAFLVHVASTLVSYFFRPNKPSIAFSNQFIAQ